MWTGTEDITVARRMKPSRSAGERRPGERVVDGVLNVDPLLALIIMGLLVFAEDALFVGFVVPGETAAVLGGVVASRGAGAGQSAGRPEP